MTTTYWYKEQASPLAANIYNTAVLDAIQVYLADGMTFETNMTLAGWLISRVVDHRDATTQRAEVQIEYNHGQFHGHAQMVGTQDQYNRYVITDHLHQPMTSANTLHEALTRALQELVQIEPIDWPARWPHATPADLSQV